MDRKKEIELLLESLKLKGYSRAQIEAELGYSENYIDQALSKGGNKKFLLSLKRLDSNILEKATLPGEGIEVKKERSDGPEKAKSGHFPGQDISLEAIKNLTESGKELALAQKIMVNNESRLISLLEQKSTADSSKDNGVASPKVMSGILVAMAKIASGTRWHSEDEALRELGRLLSPQADESKIVGGIQTDAGKTSTGK